MITANAVERDGPTLIATSISKVYQTGGGTVHALGKVSLSLYPREFVVLLGPSGSGKSTLLNILGGLDTPSSGSVHFHGEDLADYDDAQLTRYRRDHVGFVFQFYNLIASLTAEENVALVTEIAGDPMSTEQALQRVGLSDRAHHFPAELSGGEQQRVAIARAIAKQPQLLLCDEPTGALDSKTGTLVLAAIENLHLELGTTTVVITHNAVIGDMADRVIVLGDGNIVEERRNSTRRSARSLSW